MRPSRRTGTAGKTVSVIGVAAVLAAASLTLGGPASTGAEEAGRRTHVVEIRSFKFLPRTFTVRRGDVIVWVNKDIVPHTATAKDGSWDTGPIAAGARARMVIDGDLFDRYLCSYHRSMTARLDM